MNARCFLCFALSLVIFSKFIFAGGKENVKPTDYIGKCSLPKVSAFPAVCNLEKSLLGSGILASAGNGIVLKTKDQVSFTVLFQGREIQVFYSMRAGDLILTVADPVNQKSASAEPLSSKACLVMKIKPAKATGFIEWLNSNCPEFKTFPSVHRGAFFLGLAESIGQMMGLRELDLIDASEVRCEKDDSEVDLRFLRTMQKGEGWYESKGFLSADSEGYKIRMEEFSSLPLDVLLSSLQVLEPKIAPLNEYLDSSLDLISSRQKDAIRKYFSNLTTRLPAIKFQMTSYLKDHPKGASLGSFLTFLWGKDGATCQLYNQLVSDLFPSESKLLLEALGLHESNPQFSALKLLRPILAPKALMSQQSRLAKVYLSACGI